MIKQTTADSKARYWVAVGYPENMRDDWQDTISQTYQLPGCYIIHDKDTTSRDEEDRKKHVHIILAFPNTTTYKNALSIFRELNADGKEAFPTCQKINNIRWMYDYLIHDTEDSRKKGKFQYSPSERIAFNNFDIGNYEQVDIARKKEIKKDLYKLIQVGGYTNFFDFYEYVMENMSEEYADVAHDDSAFFERLTRGQYLKLRCVNEAEKSNFET